MFQDFGENITKGFKKFMPDSFVFALILTVITAVSALIWMNKSPLEVIIAWYDGFFDLLAFWYANCFSLSLLATVLHYLLQ